MDFGSDRERANDVFRHLIVIMVLMSGAQQPPICRTKVAGLPGMVHALMFTGLLNEIAHAYLDAPSQY